MPRHTYSHTEGTAAHLEEVLCEADNCVGWKLLLSTRDQSIRGGLCVKLLYLIY